MAKRHKQERAQTGGETGLGARDTNTGSGLMSNPIIGANSPLCQVSIPRDTALGDALERARCDYWQAWDRHEFTQADAHAAHYRALLKRAIYGAGVDARLARIEQKTEKARCEMDALELRLVSLEAYYV